MTIHSHPIARARKAKRLDLIQSDRIVSRMDYPNRLGQPVASDAMHCFGCDTQIEGEGAFCWRCDDHMPAYSWESGK